MAIACQNKLKHIPYQAQRMVTILMRSSPYSQVVIKSKACEYAGISRLKLNFNGGKTDISNSNMIVCLQLKM